MGVNVSMPLVADRGRPFDFATSWTFLAVTSTASTVEHERKVQETGLGTHCSWRCGYARPLGGYRELGWNSLDFRGRQLRPDHEARFCNGTRKIG